MLKDPECALRYEESLRAMETQDPLSLAHPPQPAMAFIREMQARLATLPQVELPPVHHFAPGVYVRELAIPADTFVVGKLHRHDHIVMLIQGEATILTPDGVISHLKAPAIWLSKAGVKRALKTHSDAIFVTVHPTNETDLDAIEADVIVPEELPMLEQGVSP